MTLERWRRIEDLYHRALERDPAERPAFLQQAAAGDQALQDEVVSLLEQRDQAEHFLAVPAADLAAKALARDLTPAKTTALQPGARLGPYEIVSLIGTGGMGHVYRARDTRLDRTVAVKVLPPEIASSSQWRSRFEQEARAISRLSHPRICVLYDVGRQDGLDYLVMEYLEGETLAARLERGPLPLAEALRYAIQIADALDKAHACGVTHRDVKPGNIFLCSQSPVPARSRETAPAASAGRVREADEPAGAKLLDFGLAKLDPELRPPSSVTVSGTFVGTRHYMAPEQIEGGSCGPRTDIFALGATLFETVTGRKAFQGKTAAAVTAAVLDRERPSLAALAPSAPAALDRAVAKCLTKDPEQRWPSAAALAAELKDILKEVEGRRAATPGTAVRTSSRARLAVLTSVIALAAVITVVLSFAVGNRVRRPDTSTSQGSGPSQAPVASSAASTPITSTAVAVRAPAAVTPAGSAAISAKVDAGSPRASFELTPGVTLGLESRLRLAVSPDARHVAFIPNAGGSLFLQPLDPQSAKPARQIAGAMGYPFWSPDGRHIAFVDGGKLESVDIAGGQRRILCNAQGQTGTWSQHGVVVFENRGSLFRTIPDGTLCEPIRQADTSSGARYTWPSFLPDGRHFIYLRRQGGRGAIAVGALDSDAADDRELVAAGSRALYAHPGYLVFARDGVLVARTFNARTLALGSELQIAPQIPHDSSTGNAAFSVSMDGTLVYQADNTGRTELRWLDRKGVTLDARRTGARFMNPDLSPDGRLLATERYFQDSVDIWLTDVPTRQVSRLTFDGASRSPAFSPDGRRIAFVSGRGSSNIVYVQAVSGAMSAERVAESTDEVTDWSPDGTRLLTTRNTGGNRDVWVVPLTVDGRPYPLLKENFQESRATFSPDGRWVAYMADETGRNHIYVQPFPRTGEKWRVSADGGDYASWRDDGKEIVFGSADGRVWAVQVDLGSTFRAGAPQRLFRIAGALAGGRIMVALDAKQFLAPLVVQPAGRAAMTVIQNWATSLGPGGQRR